MFLESYLRQLQVTFMRRYALPSTDERQPFAIKNNVRNRISVVIISTSEFVDNFKDKFRFLILILNSKRIWFRIRLSTFYSFDCNIFHKFIDIYSDV